MNKIIVEVSIGELFDKISILEIKKEKIKDPEKLKYITDDTFTYAFQNIRDKFEGNSTFIHLLAITESTEGIDNISSDYLTFPSIASFLLAFCLDAK